MASSLRYADLITPSDRMPDRLNELWRFGRPHVHARAVAALLAERTSEGRVSCDVDPSCLLPLDESARPSAAQFRSAGSHALIAEQLKHYGQGVRLLLSRSPEQPIHIRYETDSLLAPYTEITLEAGVHAHVIEQHQTLGEGLLFALRRITLHAGACLHLELREQGSGASRCFNISEINLYDAQLHHLSSHDNQLWAREETSVDLHRSDDKTSVCDAYLYSANALQGEQVLDQRTDQNHFSPKTNSRLLYKNVIDDKATAIFNGSILVASGAHESEAYQTNRNLMLSDRATAHSQPGLEILANKVKCSHGSATGPMDAEQLFYMQARGINRDEAQRLVARGFLQDALDRFAPSERDGEAE